MSATELIAHASTALRARRLAEVEELRVIAAWADVHSDDGPGGLIEPGGEGTPGVRDHSIGELALARRAGVISTINALADVLDLRHRMPLTWARTQTGATDLWLVRKIARMTRHLPLARMWIVDQAIARMLGRQAPPRILAVAEGKIIEADPELHRQRVEEEQRQRYVRLSTADQHGLRTLIARLDTGDAAWIEATITRVADILSHHHDDLGPQELRAKALGYLARPAELLTLLAAHTAQSHSDTHHDTPADTASSTADDMADGAEGGAGSTDADGDLGDPADRATDAPADAAGAAGAGSVKNEHTDNHVDRDQGNWDQGDQDCRGRNEDDPRETDWAEGDCDDGGPARARGHTGRHDYNSYAAFDGWADHLANHATDPHTDPASDLAGTADGLNRAIAYPTELLAALTQINWATLRPRHHLYLHLHEDTLINGVAAATRVEGLPAMTLDQIHGLLTGAHVTVKPVIDLNQHLRTDAYEHPEMIKERVHLIHGGDYWPHAPSTSRKLDHDHITPYDPNGPPGQTGTHNSAPIARRHHRYRTHAGYRVQQIPNFNNKPGTHLWTTPHGQTFITNHHGTQQLPTDAATAIRHAPPLPPHHHHDTGPPALTPNDHLDPDPTDPAAFNHAS